MDIADMVKDIVDKHPHMAALVVNRQGIIQYINETYLQVLNMPRHEVEGQDIRNITPETCTLKVLQTGKPIMGYNWVINGLRGIACSVPLFDHGETVGAFAYTIFIDIWDKKLCDKVMNKLIEKHETDPVPYSTQYDFSSLIGANPDFLNLKELAKNIASHENVTVLITGESGTGKELFAQAIHKWSKRSLFPFVRVNCAGIPNSLLESELFGYEDGAFTGARRGGKAGKLELAHNGTVFLDEIGELPLAMQSKLLVFLQERVVERLGSNKPLKVNVRILAATNRNLEHMVGENLFREDLYYRLNVGRIDIPPLRHRKEDIELLARHVLSLHSRRLGINVTDISPQVWQLLSHHQWPGNIRELENSLERAMILADAENSQCLLPHHFPALNNNINPGRNTGMANTDIKDLKTMLNEYERMVITHILTEAKQNKVQAAKYLGINLSSLYRKVRKHGIDDTL